MWSNTCIGTGGQKEIAMGNTLLSPLKNMYLLFLTNREQKKVCFQSWEVAG